MNLKQKYMIAYGKLGLIAILLFSNISIAKSQLSELPLKVAGPLPDDVILNANERVKNLEELKATNKKSAERQFRFDVVKGSSDLLRSGEILFNDEISEYLTKVLDKIISQEPSIAPFTRVYLSRSRSTNAYSLGDGILIINAGLLARAGSESELAFILGHEITHFKKNHSFDKYLGNKSMKKELLKYGGNPESLTKKLMRYSREAELEADKGGFKIFTGAGYPPEAALSALKMLEESKYNSHNDTLLLKDFFYKEGEGLEVCFNRVYEFKAIDFEKKKQEQKELNRKREEKYRSRGIKSRNSSEKDSLSSHPDMDLRISKIEKLIEKQKPQEKSGNEVNQNFFAQIKLTADLECMYSALENGQYSIALYEAMQHIQKGEATEFCYRVACESLFWLNFSTTDDRRSGLFTKTKYVGVEQYQYLFVLLQNSNAAELRKLSNVFFEKALEKYPQNEDILAFYGRQLQKEDFQKSKEIYLKYLELFPGGKHGAFIKNQINSKEI